MAWAPPTLNTTFDARLARRDQYGGIGRAVGSRRRAHDAHRTTGDGGRHREHDGGRRQRRGARGNVQSHGSHRHGDALANHPRRRLHPQRRGGLRARGISAPWQSRFRSRRAGRRSRAVGRVRIPPPRPRVPASRTPSNRCVSSRRASSPARRTAAMIAAAAAAVARGVALRGAGERRVPLGLRQGIPVEQAHVAYLESSGQHLLDRQDQHGGGAGALQVLQQFPEDALAANRMHRNPVAQSFQGYDRGGFAAGQEARDGRRGPSGARAA